MKTLLVVLLTGIGIAARAQEVPKAQNFSRYQGLLDHSPFAVATAVAPPTTASFAKDLYIANAARSPDGDLITIASTSDKNFKKYVTTKTPVDGYSISNIEWSEKVGATKVTIAKDGQFATLTFNQALLTQPLANAPNQPVQPQPMQPQIGQPPVPQPQIPQPQNPAVAMPAQPGAVPAAGAIKPAPIPMLPTPPPRVRGVIPRNPATRDGMQPAAPNATPQPEL
jgi:hypothetical protein